MKMYDIIDKKRQGYQLNKNEIEYFIKEYVKNNIPDYQVSALLMAICLKGMTDEEITNLTIAMANSGDTLDLSQINGITVDKHSTGGVGDKTTLIVGPIVASLGCKVAKMSGKGLGFTGGTIDKLESIDGYKTNIKRQDFLNQVNKIGISLISQSENLVPADKKIYALRDVTATVNSIPLIASSIMSKKIAAGSKCILLDVKVGSGAFMKTIEDATKLAQTMVNIGNMAGRETKAVITNMDIPLGHEIGNILEVKEAIDVLKGNGPEDLTYICIELATYMYMMCTKRSKEESMALVKKALNDGSAFKKFRELVIAQGGNVNLIDNQELFLKPKYTIELKAKNSGYIEHIDTGKIGIISCNLGAGRNKKEDAIDYTAGITITAKTGEFVNKGDVIAKLYTSKKFDIQELNDMYLNAITISKKQPPKPQMIYKIID